ncbi:MAG: EamA family transporter [Prevotella sp.]|nr:EamA family transporter [Prevotella sp.]
MNNAVKGFCNRWVSATSFGLIPLFSIPVMTGAVTMQTPSILVYRFAFGCLGILAVLLWKRTDLRLDRKEALEIALLALLYDVEALLMILGYKYMPSGPATTLVFSYPIWTEILMLVFFHERFSWTTILAMTLAFAGVACMSGFDPSGQTKFIGVVIELMAGLAYSFYMVCMSRMKVRNMSSLKLTFYVFLFGLVFFVLFAGLFTEGVEPIRNSEMLFNLLMLGIVCTALSNVMLIPAVKQIGATLTAILGAFEPLTAMIVSLLVFGDHLTPTIIIGFLLIIGAVMVLITTKMRPQTSASNC